VTTTTQTDPLNLTQEQFDLLLAGAIALSDRRHELSKRVPPCPKCGEARQIQIVEWTVPGQDNLFCGPSA